MKKEAKKVETANKVENILVRVTAIEKAKIKELAQLHSRGNVSNYLVTLALGRK